MLTPVIPVGGCLYVFEIGNEKIGAIVDVSLPSSSLVIFKAPAPTTGTIYPF